ncbi:hypothetical protein RF55_17575 [Lasius niger]|uniref:SAP domain-containing protein n=1 Tax=Lasius niger TaxID=67767 RepID=A0A0J7K2K6_LASNI|nr:hypothetical protein RF55_17575 [Lasius niger]
MVRTKKQENMERASLEQLNHEELKEEAQRYGLSTAGNSSTLIDSIMNHLETNAPGKELPPPTTSTQPPKTTTKKQTPAVSGPTSQPSATGTPAETPGTMNVMHEMLSVLQQQQQQINQMFQLLANREREPAAQQPQQQPQEEIPQPGRSRSAGSSLSGEAGRQTTESWPTGSAVQALAS